MKRWLLRILIGLAAVVLVSFVAMKVASESVPDGQQGPAADAMARRIEAAVNMDAWRRTGAVRWAFGGRQLHLWDRERGLSSVTWGDTQVMFDLNTRRGCAWVAGARQPEVDLPALIDSAYAKWVNDSFWLNPLGKFFDPGVERRIVRVEGGDALLVTFTQNGLTPGDSYLWLVDGDGRPRAWKMWTKIPIGGLEASWDGWQQLQSGAWVSTLHEMMGIGLPMEDVAGAASLAELPGVEGDPFARCELLTSAP